MICDRLGGKRLSGRETSVWAENRACLRILCGWKSRELFAGASGFDPPNRFFIKMAPNKMLMYSVGWRADHQKFLKVEMNAVSRASGSPPLSLLPTESLGGASINREKVRQGRSKQPERQMGPVTTRRKTDGSGPNCGNDSQGRVRPLERRPLALSVLLGW